MPLLPSIIATGFHRENYRPSDPEWLGCDRAAEVGQRVKIQLSFSEPLVTRHEDESSTWCLMGGEVDEVLAPDRVRVRMTATSDNAPIGFDEQELEAVLVRDDQYENPWLVHTLFEVKRDDRLPPTPSPIDRASNSLVARVCTIGADASDFLAALTAGLDLLAFATLPGEGEIPRRQRLAHACELGFGSIRGWKTRALYYEPTPDLFAAWLRLADSVLVVGSIEPAIDAALAMTDASVTRVAFAPADVVAIAKAAVKPALQRASL